MTRMRIITRALTAAALLTATACGSAVRTGSAAMFMAIDTLAAIRGSVNPGQPAVPLSSDVETVVTQGAGCPCATVFNDLGSATLRLVPKDPLSGAVPSSTQDVTISRIHVEYRRTDGRNVPGVDVPYPYDTFVTSTIPAAGTATVSFELVRIQAKRETPLVQLVTNRQTIAAVGDVTFYGQDRAGNTFTVSGSIQIEFANFGDF